MHKAHGALANINTNGHPTTRTTSLDTSKYSRARAKTKLSHMNRVIRIPKIVEQGESATDTQQMGE